MDFVVIDTEGKPELSELAIVNNQGQVIYEAFSKDHLNNSKNLPNLKSLKTLLTEFLTIVQDKTIVCHNAKHDVDILKYSFGKVGLIFPKLKFECTLLMAKNYCPSLESYSLEHLSKYFHLQVRNHHFIRDMAHAARYDAEFTYHLYCRLMIEQLKHQPNPFSGSRVDTPFQTHPDDPGTYRKEYDILKLILNDIKIDTNRQSKGVVITGEPGSGKTHLMMRLAKERLQSNRLLFIRQPNNSRSILYHTYSRILESLVEDVDGMTQLERLILTSSYKILNFQVTSQKDEQIIKSLDDILKNKNRDALGKEGTQQKRNSWDYIHKRIAEWWTKFYSAGGFALSIIQGLTQYCKYSDPTYKSMITRWLAGSFEEVERVDLPNWREEFSPEDFSLEGISVLAKLSILDEPLIIIFDQLEGLGLPHNGEILLNFGEAIKEIFTHVPNSLVILNMFPDRWKQFQDTFDNSIIGRVSQHQVHLTPPNETELKAILKVKLQGINLSLEQLFSSEDLEDILGQKPIRAVLNRAADYYNYKVRQIPLPVVTETLRKLDPYEKLEQQLRSFQQELQDLKQQQQLLIELVSHLSQTKQEPALIDLLTSPAFNIPVEPPTLNPLIDYLMRKKANLEKQYNQLPIISDYDDLGKLRTIAEAFSHLKPIKLRQYRLGKRVLPEHLVVETDHKNYVIGFLQITANTTSFTSRISNFNELVKMYSKDSFGLFRDQRLPEIKGKVAKEEIGKLQNTSNGNFVLLNQHDRIHFDLTYELIVDIQNKDLDVDLESALKVLIMNKEWYHDIFTMLGFTKPATDMN